MHYNFLPGTDIKVSKICLGTMTFGKQNTEADGHEQMDYALNQGINFLILQNFTLFPLVDQLKGKQNGLLALGLIKGQSR